MSHPSHPAVPLTVVILTHDEELNLPACLASVDGLVGEIFVVDSGSTDATVSIAKEAAATVLEHPFTTHATQWEWALANLPITNEWVLGLDADQRLTPELAAELRDLFLDQPARLDRVDGFYVNRRQVFRGRWIRHGGYYPKYLLKLFRLRNVRLDTAERLDHHFYADRTTKLHHDLIEENKKEDLIGFWLQKHLRYATLLSEEAVSAADRPSGPGLTVAALREPDQRMLVLKAIWQHLPRYWRSFAFFGYRYFLRRGFLDGREGFVFHFLQSCWFRLVVDVMIEERTIAAGSGRAT